MKRQYEFAGIGIEIDIPDQWMYEDERVLKDFRIDTSLSPHRFQFHMTDSFDSPAGTLEASYPDYRAYVDGDTQLRYIGAVSQSWENAYLRVLHQNKDHTVHVKQSVINKGIGIKTVLNSLAAEHLVLEANGAILHASFIAHNGQALLFTAPSETGKSTQAQLWANLRNADIINGDRAVIRLIDGKPHACGIPFAGSSKHCKNATLPLAAIVYLGQASETTIGTFGFKTAFRKVWEGCTVNTWNPDDLNKAIDIVQNITLQVPVYHLQCTPDESAVIALEKELEKL